MDTTAVRGDGGTQMARRSVILYRPQATNPKASSPSTAKPRPFPYLELPLEMQRLILAHYFGRWSVVMGQQRYSMFRSKYTVEGLPPFAILLASRGVYEVASEVRQSCFTGHLTLKSVFLLIPLRKKADLQWLKTNVRTLRFEDSSVNPERWTTYLGGFEKLEHLEIDNPAIIRLGVECLDLQSILDGKNWEPLVANMETFRAGLVSGMKNIVSVVVSQRYCLRANVMAMGWTGLLHGKITLTRTGILVSELNHDSLATVMSKREFSGYQEL